MVKMNRDWFTPYPQEILRMLNLKIKVERQEVECGIWGKGEFILEKNHILDTLGNVCKHAQVLGTIEFRDKTITYYSVPRVLIAKDTFGITGICVDCLLEALKE